MHLKSLINKVWLYIKYPVSLKMDLSKAFKHAEYKKLKLVSLPPNYIFFNKFNNDSIILDVGCGFEAELSTTFIDRYGLKAFAVDPTLKHASSLNEIEMKYPDNFKHLPFALSAENGETSFFEAENCESGSLLSSHKNVMTHHTTEYKVKLIDLPGLIELTAAKEIDFLKIDIEGAEYSLFNTKNLNALKKVKQLFIEFHHISIDGISAGETKKVVRKIENEGFRSFTYDGLNYLFFKQ